MHLVKKWRRALSLGLVLGSLAPFFAGSARAQDPEKVPPPTARESGDDDGSRRPTPAGRAGGRFLVGDPAPDVKLPDANGRSFRLASERRAKPWLLVFVRRPNEVPELDAEVDAFTALGLGVAVIAPFGADRVAALGAPPRVRLLFDRASVTARTFGVHDPLTSNPRPGAFLVDKRGRFVWMVAGGLPSAAELVRMTQEALEAQEAAQQRAVDAGR